MTKQAQIDYFQKLSPEAVAYERNRPFVDDDRSAELMSFAAILQMLPAPPARVLDVGCGMGWTSCMLARVGYDVTGSDICAEFIEFARRAASAEDIERITFEVADFEDLSYRDEFDVVLFFESLHHSEREDLALAAACNALRSGGVCITCEPGEGHAVAFATSEAVARCGVAERGMPPRTIMAQALQVGFREARAFPSPRMLPYALPRRRSLRSVFRYSYGRDLVFVLKTIYSVARKRHLGGICVLIK